MLSIFRTHERVSCAEKGRGPAPFAAELAAGFPLGLSVPFSWPRNFSAAPGRLILRARHPRKLPPSSISRGPSLFTSLEPPALLPVGRLRGDGVLGETERWGAVACGIPGSLEPRAKVTLGTVPLEAGAGSAV